MSLRALRSRNTVCWDKRRTRLTRCCFREIRTRVGKPLTYKVVARYEREQRNDAISGLSAYSRMEAMSLRSCCPLFCTLCMRVLAKPLFLSCAPLPPFFLSFPFFSALLFMSPSSSRHRFSFSLPTHTTAALRFEYAYSRRR